MTGGRGCEDAVRGAGRSPGRQDVQEAEGRKRSGGRDGRHVTCTERPRAMRELPARLGGHCQSFPTTVFRGQCLGTKA